MYRRLDTPTCLGCGNHPDELDEYVSAAEAESEEYGKPITPTQYLMREEGTYNGAYNTFWCSPCYIKAGMPLGKAGPWRGAPLFRR